MAELETIARPYAKAAFRYAVQNDSLQQWLDMLSLLAQVASDPAMVPLYGDPKVTDAQLGEVFKDVLGDALDEASKNFVDILSDNGRLAALGSIYSLYHKLYEENQRKVSAKVTVAQELTEAQLAKVKQALEKRLKQDVEIETIIDPAVYGGIRVQANDLVIDGTVQGRLQRLFDNLT